MCGIAGRVNFRSGAPVDPRLVQGMCDILAHRGPDADGVMARGAVGLGHRRLAIIDLSPAGRQPMSDATGDLTITYNGEIYNFRELRSALEARGHRFRTRTDTEVILAAYREYGAACLDHLRGMFAFAIWDDPNRTLFVARDRIGKKPLHYYVDDDGLAFASEPKAFLADPSFQARPNLEAISQYLSLQYVPSPLSAFAGVSKLPPAHYLVVRDSRVSTHRYWRLSYEPKREITENAACEELRARLEEAVRIRLMSDVPLGAFLSGGIDSGAVVAMMARLGSAPVKTFSIGFEQEEYNELPYARAIARRYSTDHQEFVVRPNAVEIFDRLAWHYNEPYADESAIPTFYLSELTRRHVTVALNGDGGDENFAGYARYLDVPAGPSFALRRAAGLVERLLPAATHSDAYLWKVKRRLQRMAAAPGVRYAWRMMQFDPFVKGLLCTPAFLDASGGDAAALLSNAYACTGAAGPVDAMIGTDVAYYLPDCLLVKVDIATMAHGLEGRSPLLDHEFMEYAARLPEDLKLRHGTQKYVFRRAVSDLLPDTVLNRRKMGFGVPLDHWFRGELKEMAWELLLAPSHLQRGYFKPSMVRRLLDEHGQRRVNWQHQLFNMVMLELWHRSFIDARPSVSRAALSASPHSAHPV